MILYPLFNTLLPSRIFGTTEGGELLGTFIAATRGAAMPL
jgi:hypothetical protein